MVLEGVEVPIVPKALEDLRQNPITDHQGYVSQQAVQQVGLLRAGAAE